MKKSLARNTIASLCHQVTTVICGFILPRLIIQSYGSEVNGLISSIAQFLSVVSFLELGVGAVVQSALYKPLADNDDDRMSEILSSATKFFKRIAVILVIYICGLIFIYPRFMNQTFDGIYIALLILVMGISSFAQYYFGIVDKLLVTSDQRGYIQYNVQTITLILNTIVCSLLMYKGVSIHIVKLVTALLYLVRPVAIRIYVNRKYNINRKIHYSDEPIKQKWNGIAQHVASYVLNSTDAIVLTVFSNLNAVSIYSVYYLVISGIMQIVVSLTGGLQALMGELWAKKKLKKAMDMFQWMEWIIHTGVTVVFGCTGVLILPFVQVYTNGITDVDYIQPLFAILITIAYAVRVYRLPYNIMILAVGHYKQTQHNYIIAAILNLSFSILFVVNYGLVGVAVGTLVAMLYQTIWMAYYNSKNIIVRSHMSYVKQWLVDIITVILGIIGVSRFILNEVSYLSWILLAIKVVIVWIIVAIVVNSMFYIDKIKLIISNVFSIFKINYIKR